LWKLADTGIYGTGRGTIAYFSAVSVDFHTIITNIKAHQIFAYL
jgi:hypothetical protein